MRRFRVTFAKGEAVRYISHLDLMRTWERVLRRAGLKLAHTQGFNPRPRLVFAAPLPVGVTSDAELVDVVIEDELSAAGFQERVREALCPGVEVTAVAEVPLEAPAVMACTASSDYVVALRTSKGCPLPREGEGTQGNGLEGRIAEFLARDTVPYERRRKGTSKQADMRPAVLDLWPAGEGRVGVRLRLDVEGLAVRPEEVIAAIDPSWEVTRVHRTALVVKPTTSSATAPALAAEEIPRPSRRERESSAGEAHAA